MSNINHRVSRLAKAKPEYVHKREIVKVVHRSEMSAIDLSIEPRIRQNERERTASMSAAAKCIVGGSLGIANH